MAIKTRQQLLAWDLVEGLADEKHKGIYFHLAKIYDEAFLREILSRVKDAYNQDKIKSQDRGRYFMGILSKETYIYGKNTKNSSGKRSGFKKKSRANNRSKKS